MMLNSRVRIQLPLAPEELAIGGCVMVEQSTHDPKFKGLSPATAGPGRTGHWW
jgi:hypothetical protein